MTKNREICSLLDILTLDMLDLIEQQVQCKVNIEKQKSEGDMMMAKARYIQGVTSVSAAQLPTENSVDFNALATVTGQTNEESGIQEFSIVRHPIDKDEGYVNPINWFGVLVPRCLQTARERFEKTIDLVVEAVNIQNQLRNCMYVIANLTKAKYSS